MPVESVESVWPVESVVRSVHKVGAGFIPARFFCPLPHPNPLPPEGGEGIFLLWNREIITSFRNPPQVDIRNPGKSSDLLDTGSRLRLVRYDDCVVK